MKCSLVRQIYLCRFSRSHTILISCWPKLATTCCHQYSHPTTPSLAVCGLDYFQSWFRWVGLDAGNCDRRSLCFCLGSGGMPQGTIKKLTDKGFGFIEGERGDIFFHHSALEETTYENLREGQKVEYSEGQGPKGPRAESVRLVD